MIPDKERKDHRKMTELLHIPNNDLCSRFNKMHLKSPDTSKNNFSKMKVESKVKEEINDKNDAINKIGEKLSNIKICNGNDMSTNTDKLKITASKQVFNIVCDNVLDLEDNLCEDQHASSTEVKDELDNVKSEIEEPFVKDVLKEQNVEEQGHASNAASLVDRSEHKEDKDSEINENKNEKLEETKKADKNDKGLCSRGPVFPQKFSQPSFQPYEKGTWINSTNTQSGFLSGCEVLQVAEPLGQPSTAYQQWNDVTNYNVIRNEFEHLVSRVPPSSLVNPVAPMAPLAPAAGPSLAAAPAPTAFVCSAASGQIPCLPEGDENCSEDDVIKGLFNNYPVIRSVLDEVINENNTQTKTKIAMPQETIWKDEGLPSSPSGSDRSPPGSPNGSLQRPPPTETTSNSEKDSGTESPRPVMDCMGDNSLQSSLDDRIWTWVQASQQNPNGPVVNKYRHILPKPETETVKSRFQKILDPERKLQAWAKIQTHPDNFFLKADEDGDTQLMIVVSNNYEGQLELIYAMVERMRKIPSSLNLKNNSGLSALYLACKVLHKQPLVAAYIAEALLEQNVDIAKLRYENGLTLLEILENERETHDAVLKELLALKDSNGRSAFPMHQWNELFYKDSPEKLVNLPSCL